MGQRLYVGGLPYSTTEDQLRDAFANYGKVDEVNIPVDPGSGRSRGFGFVEMSNAGEAQAAIDGLNDTDLGGRTIRVNEARPRDNGGRGGGGPRRDRDRGDRRGSRW